MKGIFYTGEIEQSCIAQILSEVYIDRVYAPFVEGKQNLVIVDCGANVGITAQYFARYARCVIAVEPSSVHCACIREMMSKNVRRNSEGWIHVEQCALSDHDDTEFLYEFPGNSTMNTLQPGVQGWKKSEAVKTITIKRLFDHYSLDHVDLLKLDIEGGEAAVLRSPEFAEVAPMIDCIVGEWHSWAAITQREVQDILCMLGFRFQWIPRKDGSQLTMFSAQRKG